LLHCILYELGRNQEIQQILYEEIKDNCKDDDDDFSEEKLNSMAFLKAVFKETLRFI
jgi:hypothetical protein